MRKRLIILMSVLCTLLAAISAIHCGGNGADFSADSILSQIGVSKGICIVLGDTHAELAIELAVKSRLTVYCQLQDGDAVETARRAVDAAGLYGTRVFVEQGALSRIHMAENIADALVAVGDAVSVTESEALRVVRPEGKVIIGSRELVKAVPEGIDDWPHPYHSPDNNPQSNDTVAKAPYLTRFLAGPYYAPLPQMTVSSAGRVFRSLGHIAFKAREEKYLNTLMAQNGYNGTILWTRELKSGIMVHRSTMIATPEKLYIGDDKSCKVIDTVTGEILDEIIPPEDKAGGTFWKWMALEDGVLYALIGEQEMKDPEVRGSWEDHGWPWKPLSRGFNEDENPWGFGKNLLAIDVTTKEVLWDAHFDDAVDSRSLCMKDGKLFAFRFASFLACVDAATGNTDWMKTVDADPDFFEVIGNNLNRQDWRTNFRTESYVKCGDGILYFAGPMFDKLIALSTKDGSVAWTHPYDNFQLVLNDDALYGISGPWAENESRKFDPVTGQVLGEFAIGRRACTRPTGAADAIFFRANGGSVRFDLASERQQYMSPMRPTCFDGVTIANGLLYWWPSTCDCQLTLYGTVGLGPAGDHDFYGKAKTSDRLEKGPGYGAKLKDLAVTSADWPTFRANNQCTAASQATIPGSASKIWEYMPTSPAVPTAPVAAGGLVFTGGSDGVIRALNASDGTENWSAYTGGSVRVAPTVWNNSVLAGSGDGCVYSLEAATGKTVYRFRAAPEDRKIPVYGSLMSTWPVASGVVVEDGVAYAAAGISNFDGTYVYAFDAATGEIQWQNTTSGHLNKEARTGVGVQGHLLLNEDTLYMAGGNAVSPAAYDISDGACLNNGDLLNIGESICLRGWELYLVGDKVAVGGQPFYRDPEYPVYDKTVREKMLHATAGDRDIVWLNGELLRCYPPLDKKLLSAGVNEREYPGRHIIASWGRFEVENKPMWECKCPESVAVAVCKNAVVIVTENDVKAIDLNSGSEMWRAPLPSSPVCWGLAIDRDGRVIVTLKDGRVVCFG